MAEGAGELGRRRVYPNSMGLWPHPITPVTPARPLKHPVDCSLSLSPLYHLSRSTEVREVFHDMKRERERERASEQASPLSRKDAHRRGDVRRGDAIIASSTMRLSSPRASSTNIDGIFLSLYCQSRHRDTTSSSSSSSVRLNLGPAAGGPRTSVIVLTNFRAGASSRAELRAAGLLGSL